MKTTAYLTLTILMLFFNINNSFSQVGIGTTSPDPGAALEIKSTDGGFLPPRMTKAERDAIDVSSNPEGLLIFQTDNKPGFYFYKDGAWRGFSVDRPVLVPKLVIPRCHKYASDTGNKLTGDFDTTIDGTLTHVHWKMFWANRTTQENSTTTVTDTNGNQVNVILKEVKSEKVEVEYKFTPPLPFEPKSIMFTTYRDTSGNNYPDTFVVSIVNIDHNATRTKLTVNISRTDIYGDHTDCWWGEDFKFDALIIE